MDADDYQTQALRTVSTGFHTDVVSGTAVAALISDDAWSYRADALDDAKKSLFYGKSFPTGSHHVTMAVAGGAGGYEAITVDRSGEYLETLPKGGPRDALHAIIGVRTEAQELIELLNLSLVDRSRLDPDEVLDELGDVLWYAALLAASQGSTLSEAMRRNVAKLRKRFPDRFSGQLAIAPDKRREAEAMLS